MAPVSHGTENLAKSWAERAAEHSPAVERSRIRSVQRAEEILEAAKRLIALKGADFTAVELAKEAGIAIQTFYKHFGSKDQVMLAVLSEMISTTCVELEAGARELPDPVARLRFYLTRVLRDIGGAEGISAPGARFLATEHWRLQQSQPAELAAAIRPFVALLENQIRAAAAADLLAPTSVEYDAWLATQLVVAVFHHYAFSTAQESIDEITEGLWAFCLGAWGGRGMEKPRRTVRRN